tara:strand:- start:339 stop:566 length:228 start_codon:yes stop_codon:yes gene_type:complete
MKDVLVETTKLSQRGQVVIPMEIREKLNLETGNKFFVIASDNSLILQKFDYNNDQFITRDLMSRAKDIIEKLKPI